MSTVASKLLDATELVYINPLHRVMTSQGDVLRVGYVPYYENRNEAMGFFVMTPAQEYEVDGIEYFRGSNNQRATISLKPAVECWGDRDEQDRCDCRPHEYQPLSYRYGEICETCWVEHQTVVGIGMSGCRHWRARRSRVVEP